MFLDSKDLDSLRGYTITGTTPRFNVDGLPCGYDILLEERRYTVQGGDDYVDYDVKEKKVLTITTGTGEMLLASLNQ